MSISIYDLLKYENLIEYTSVLMGLYKDSLWLLSVLIVIFQNQYYFLNTIKYILLSILNETKQLKTRIDFQIRDCVYLCIKIFYQF